ncbi:MAG: CoA-binding protein [Candidatus Melainabacteria bacterium HGW-Melainabacteria-1]|nr:MAG: CoA-binding protein [Candidatus Melainabacteria bacterium HGW-Melainabacteria-1]
MGFQNDDSATLLRQARTIAVVGLSDSPDRDSYRVARYLIQVGYTIFPVNPGIDEVMGVKSYKSLLDVPESVDIVDVFRRPEYVPQIVEAAIQTGARALWLQFGVIHAAAAKQARDAGLKVVMDRCIKIDHAMMG